MCLAAQANSHSIKSVSGAAKKTKSARHRPQKKDLSPSQPKISNSSPSHTTLRGASLPLPSLCSLSVSCPMQSLAEVDATRLPTAAAPAAADKHLAVAPTTTVASLHPDAAAPRTCSQLPCRCSRCPRFAHRIARNVTTSHACSAASAPCSTRIAHSNTVRHTRSRTFGAPQSIFFS